MIARRRRIEVRHLAAPVDAGIAVVRTGRAMEELVVDIHAEVGTRLIHRITEAGRAVTVGSGAVEVIGKPEVTKAVETDAIRVARAGRVDDQFVRRRNLIRTVVLLDEILRERSIRVSIGGSFRVRDRVQILDPADSAIVSAVAPGIALTAVGVSLAAEIINGTAR